MMNNIRRLSTLLLALVMLFSMSVPAFATDDEAVCTMDDNCTLTEGHSEGCPKAIPAEPTCTMDDNCTLTEGHSEGCPKIIPAKPTCTMDDSCTLTEGHSEGCPKIVPAKPTCTMDDSCTLTEGHAEGCPKIVPAKPTCTMDDSCTLTEGHTEGCPKIVPTKPTCTMDDSCTLTEGHSEGCPKIVPAEQTHIEGCILGASHEGECKLKQQKTCIEGCILTGEEHEECLIEAQCEKDAACILNNGHPGDCVFDEAVMDTSLSGSGTEADPYMIATIDDLMEFRRSVNANETIYNTPTTYVALAADIDMKDVDWSVNIGDDCNYTFDGIFDGKGKTIKNLSSTETAQKSDGYICTGLFGAIGGSAVIKNLTIENVNISTGNYTGNNAAAVVGFAYNASGSVENVSVIGDINIDAKKVDGTGVIVGYAYEGTLTVKDCVVFANDDSLLTGQAYVGGIIGYAGGKSTLSDNTVENLSIDATSCSVGGVAGIMLNGSVASDNTIKNTALSAAHENWQNAIGLVTGTFTGNVTVSGTVSEGNGTTAIVGALHAEKPTAPLGKAQAINNGVYYSTLEEAIEKVKPGETIALVSDINLSETLTIAADKNFTLDLSGFSISGSYATHPHSMIVNNGTLSIVDTGSSKGKISYQYTGSGDSSYGKGNYTITNCGTLTMTGITAENTTASMKHMYDVIDNNSTSHDAVLTLNDCFISCPNYRSIRQFANSTNTKNDVIINGGTFEGQIWVQSPNSNANNASLSINGGSFEPRGKDGSAVFLELSQDLNLSFSVTDGDFLGKIGINNPSNKEIQGSLITGGSFSENAKSGTNVSLLSPGFQFLQNSDGTFSPFETSKGLTGSGTEKDPYLINSLADLITFRDSVNAGDTTYNADGVYVALNSNIDMAGINWSVNIGDDCNYTFDGIFDGKGKTIKNLSSTETAQKSDGYICTGLFGAIGGSAVIKNLTIENVNISTGNYTGNNAAAVVGFAYIASGSVENVSVIGDIQIDAKKVDGTGVIVGYAYEGTLTVKNCKVSGSNGSSLTGQAYVGGIIGYAGGKSTLSGNTVENLSINATSCSVGGVAGIMLNGSVASDNTIKNTDLSAAHENWQNAIGLVTGTFTGNVTVSGTVSEGNGTTAIVGALHAEKPTAPLGKAQAVKNNVYYGTIVEAISAAAANDTITLLDKLTLGEAISIPGNLTIDIGLNTISRAEGFGGSIFSIPEGVELKIEYAQGNSMTIADMRSMVPNMCVRPGSFIIKASHSGGTASCTQQAVCTDCNQPYGEKLDHSYIYKVDSAKPNVIKESCQNCNTHNATATLELKKNFSTTYTGSAIDALTVSYSAKSNSVSAWVGPRTLTVSYLGTNGNPTNIYPGKATGKISIKGADDKDATAVMIFDINKMEIKMWEHKDYYRDSGATLSFTIETNGNEPMEPLVPASLYSSSGKHLKDIRDFSVSYKNGDAVITLPAYALKGLDVGRYELRVSLADSTDSDNTVLAEAVDQFRVRYPRIIPSTGDSANFLLWGGMLLGAAVAMGAVLILLKKGGKKNK